MWTFALALFTPFIYWGISAWAIPPHPLYVALWNVSMWITIPTLYLVYFLIIWLGRLMPVKQYFPDRIQWGYVNMRKSWTTYDKYRWNYIGHGPLLIFDRRFCDEDEEADVFDPYYWIDEDAVQSLWLYAKMRIASLMDVLYGDPIKQKLPLMVGGLAITFLILLGAAYLILDEAGNVQERQRISRDISDVQ
jgi:hypothetical protein